MPFRASLLSAWSCQECIIFIVCLFCHLISNSGRFSHLSTFGSFLGTVITLFCFGSLPLLNQLPPALSGLKPLFLCLLSVQLGKASPASLCTDGGWDCAHWDTSAGVALRASSHSRLAPRCFFSCPLSTRRLILQDPSCACSSGRYSQFLFFGFQEHRNRSWQAFSRPRLGAVPVSFPPHLSISASHRASPD